MIILDPRWWISDYERLREWMKKKKEGGEKMYWREKQRELTEVEALWKENLKTVMRYKKIKCPKCEGLGLIVPKANESKVELCSMCGGTGYITIEEV